MLIIWSQLQLNSLSPAQPGPARPRPWPRTSLRRGCRDEMSSLFGEQQSRRFPSTSDRLWTESWWIFRTRARALAQPAYCYRAALTNLCRCINRSQAALTRPPCFSPQQKKKKKKEEGQINKWGEKSCVFPPQTKRPPSERGGRLHIRLTDLFDFVWHFLFMRLFIFSSRLSPSEEI